jgi:hypothetical protein
MDSPRFAASPGLALALGKSKTSMVALVAPPNNKPIFFAAADKTRKKVEGPGESIHRIVARGLNWNLDSE